ncbi:hypothetical protein Lfu02_80710 [Longispora fulva]|uniref:Uncharacterized protein n=1 Tax=Longispora fulva TaxID=619741 RepID=A0A8J7GH63_9ACTN|nr:hypothetical protein [Longispora fulva]MBG6134189.1 hypothetical protein [Longispora fulva]MBG6137228.1 hypothetical protein [Longispora fulva]GIG63699.1 hypothetical protein Lfu02_80710 [Longispora fulva]
MTREPQCTDPRCADERLSHARFTRAQLETFTALAKARVRPVPCATFPGEYHTMRRAENLAGSADWAVYLAQPIYR